MTAPLSIDARRDLDAIVRDETAFRSWFDAAMPRVYRYLLARCGGDQHVAEELTQATFVEAIRRRDRFAGRSDTVTWLIAIARNKLVDHHRRLERDERRHGELVAAHRLHDDAPWRASETRDAVSAALRRLPPEHRIALLFRYLDGLSIRDVAAAIGRSEKATESLLGRARDTFRRAYGGQTDA